MANKLWLAAVLVLASGAASSQVNPNQLKWGPAPPGLPPGAQLAVLSGNPGAAGPFVPRFQRVTARTGVGGLAVATPVLGGLCRHKT